MTKIRIRIASTAVVIAVNSLVSVEPWQFKPEHDRSLSKPKRAKKGKRRKDWQ